MLITPYQKNLALVLVLLLLTVGCGKQEAVEFPSPTQKEVQRPPDRTTESTLNPAPEQVSPVALPTNTPKRQDYITYKGIEGKTALELLKASHKVETKDFSGLGEYVESIDGYKPDAKHFWKFFVNGKSSTVGASSYITKSSDVLEWKTDKIGNE